LPGTGQLHAGPGQRRQERFRPRRTAASVAAPKERQQEREAEAAHGGAACQSRRTDAGDFGSRRTPQ
jgi:hypothetical protein